MLSQFDDIHRVAQAIIERLRHPAVQWMITDIVPAADTPFAIPEAMQPPGLPAPHPVAVMVSDPDRAPSDTVVAYFLPDIPLLDAIVALASQLQDHAIETSWGAPLPVCPGHAHPLSARVLDGEAVWVCPITPSHHRELIEG